MFSIRRMNSSPLRTGTKFLAVLAGLTLTGSLALAQSGSLTLGQETSGSKNLLVNGDFTKGTEGWTFDPHAKHGVMTLDPNEKHGNNPSVRIENAQDDDSHLKQKVTVEPETRYRLEGYIKTKDARSTQRDGKGGASLDLEGTRQKSLSVNKTKSWTRVSVDIITGAETEVEVGGRLGFWNDGVVGTAWFADLSLVKIGKAPPRR